MVNYHFDACFLDVDFVLRRAKLGQGLLSGEYSRAVPEEPEVITEPTIRVSSSESRVLDILPLVRFTLCIPCCDISFSLHQDA